MRNVTIYDAGEQYADRYTVLMHDTHDAYTMSDDANMPNGVCMYVNYTQYRAHVHTLPVVAFADLPQGTQRQIVYLRRTL